MGLTLESEPGAETINAKILDFIVSLQKVMPTETCWFTPTLINTVHGVIAVDGLFQIIYLQITLTLVTIMIQNNMNRTILLRCDTEDGRMTATRHLHFQMLLRQTNGIIVGMRDLVGMRERRCPLLWSQTQLTSKSR